MYDIKIDWVTEEGANAILKKLKEEQESLTSCFKKMKTYEGDWAGMECIARKYTMFRNALIFDIYNFADVASENLAEQFGKIINEIREETFVAEEYFEKAFRDSHPDPNESLPEIYLLDGEIDIPVFLKDGNRLINPSEKIREDTESAVHALDYITREKEGGGHRSEAAKRAASVFKLCEEYALLVPLKNIANGRRLSGPFDELSDVERKQIEADRKLSDTAAECLKKLSRYVSKTASGYSVQLSEFRAPGSSEGVIQKANQTNGEGLNESVETLFDKAKRKSYVAYISRKYEYDTSLNDITDVRSYESYNRYWDNGRIQRIDGKDGKPRENGDYFLLKIKPDNPKLWSDAISTIIKNDFKNNRKESWEAIKKAMKGTFGKYDKLYVMDYRTKKVIADISDLYNGDLRNFPETKRPALAQRIEAYADYHLSLTELFYTQKEIDDTWKKHISPAYSLYTQIDSFSREEMGLLAERIREYWERRGKEAKKCTRQGMTGEEREVYGMISDGAEFERFRNSLAARMDKKSKKVRSIIEQKIYTGKEEFVAGMDSLENSLSPEFEELVNLLAYEKDKEREWEGEKMEEAVIS